MRTQDAACRAWSAPPTEFRAPTRLDEQIEEYREHTPLIRRQLDEMHAPAFGPEPEFGA